MLLARRSDRRLPSWSFNPHPLRRADAAPAILGLEPESCIRAVESDQGPCSGKSVNRRFQCDRHGQAARTYQSKWDCLWFARSQNQGFVEVAITIAAIGEDGVFSSSL